MERTRFFRVERRARRMHDVMVRLDVDPVTLAHMRSGDAYAEARARCMFCGTSDKCLRWLDQPNPSSTRPHFCPNLSMSEACTRGRTDAANTSKANPTTNTGR
jgi:hypothetical protein